MKVLIFCVFGLKTPIHAPKNWGFGGFDSNQILHINSQGGRSNIFDMTSKLVEEFWRGGGAKMGLSH